MKPIWWLLIKRVWWWFTITVKNAWRLIRLAYYHPRVLFFKAETAEVVEVCGPINESLYESVEEIDE